MFGSHFERLEVLWVLGPTKALRVRDYFYGVGSQDVRHEGQKVKLSSNYLVKEQKTLLHLDVMVC
jgi:hypothetical protein